MSIKSDLNILKGFNNKDPFEIINENYYEENRKNMQGQILIIWYFKQFYKYILFILAIFIFKYGTIYTFLILIINLIQLRKILLMKRNIILLI